MVHLLGGYHTIRLKCLGNSKKNHQAFILIITFFAYALYHASRKPLSVVKTVFHKQCPTVQDRKQNWCQWKPFDTDNWSQLVGSLEYAFLISYACFMFPCGHLAERLNLRIFLSLGMSLSGITTIMFGLGFYLDIHVISYYMIIQILGGAVQATGWPIIITILSNWLGTERRGLIMGIWNANTNFGNVIGSLIAGMFVKNQWGASFVVPGVLLILFAYGVLFVLVDKPHSNLQISHSSPSRLDKFDNSSASLLGIKRVDQQPFDKLKTKTFSSTTPISFVAALCLPNVLAYAMTLFFSKLVAYTFLYWLPNYLSSVSIEKISPEHAAVLSTIFDVGGILGGILAGVLSDFKSKTVLSPNLSNFNTQYLRAVTCAGMFALAGPSLMFYQSLTENRSAFSLVVLFLCGLLVTGPCALITTAVSADLGTQPALQGNSKALATVTAIIDGTGSLGAALGPFLTGILVPYGWFSVFVMLSMAEIVALVISTFIAIRTARHISQRIIQLETLEL